MNWDELCVSLTPPIVDMCAHLLRYILLMENSFVRERKAMKNKVKYFSLCQLDVTQRVIRLLHVRQTANTNRVREIYG